MTGTARIDGSSRTGSPTKGTVTIGTLTKDGPDVLPAVTVVTADDAGEQMRFTVGGSDDTPAQAAVLSTVVSPDRPERVESDDAILCTPKPRPVGGTWDGDPVKLAAELPEQHVPASAEHFQVTLKLAEVKQVDGTPSEVIAVTFWADRLDTTQAGQGRTVTGGSCAGTLTATLPVDPAGTRKLTVQRTMTPRA